MDNELSVNAVKDLHKSGLSVKASRDVYRDVYNSKLSREVSWYSSNEFSVKVNRHVEKSDRPVRILDIRLFYTEHCSRLDPRIADSLLNTTWWSVCCSFQIYADKMSLLVRDSSSLAGLNSSYPHSPAL